MKRLLLAIAVGVALATGIAGTAAAGADTNACQHADANGQVHIFEQQGLCTIHPFGG